MGDRGEEEEEEGGEAGDRVVGATLTTLTEEEEEEYRVAEGLVMGTAGVALRPLGPTRLKRRVLEVRVTFLLLMCVMCYAWCQENGVPVRRKDG